MSAIGTEWFERDVSLAVDHCIDAVLLPTMKTAVDLQRLEDDLQSRGALPEPSVCTMVETLPAIAKIAGAQSTFASLRRLDGIVAGTNDVAMEARLPPSPPPEVLVPWLMQIVLGVRLLGLDVIDRTFNDTRDVSAST